MVDPNTNIDVLELVQIMFVKHLFCDSDRVVYARRSNVNAPKVLVGLLANLFYLAAVELDRLYMQPCLWFYKLPVLCCCHECVSIYHSVTIFVTEQPTRCRLFPVRVVWINVTSVVHAKMLDVAPRKVWSEAN